MRLASDFLRSKTTWAGFSTVITTIAAALNHQVNPWHAAMICLGVLHLPFLRDAWVKSAEQVLVALEGLNTADGGEVPTPAPVAAP